jgi:hypothetical protein
VCDSLSLDVGSDYQATAVTLTFTPTLAVSQVQIDLFEDLDSEGLEEFFLRISLIDAQLGVPGVVVTSTVFIEDNESKYFL